MESNQIDVLRKVASEIEAWCQEHQIVIARARLNGVPPFALEMTTTNPDGWHPFVDLAEAMASRVIALEMHEFEATEYDELLQAAESGTDRDRRETRLQALRAHRGRIGQVRQLSLAALPSDGGPPVVVDLFPEWAEVVFAEAEESDDDEQGSFVEERPSREAIDALARRVADHPDFQRAKPGQHDYVTRKILGTELDRVKAPLWQVASTAKTIWEIEIKPGKDEELRRRALALFDEGNSKAKIAAELGITAKRVTELIG